MNTALPCRKGVDDAKRSFFFFCFTNYDSSMKGAVFLFFLGNGICRFCPIILPKNSHLKFAK